MSGFSRPSRETIFQVCCPTCFGAEVRVVGSSESLGHWDPTRGFRLETTSKLHPTWRSRSAVCLEEGEIEYKYVIIKRSSSDANGQVTCECEWERGDNRLLPAVQHSKEEHCQGVLVQDSYGDPRHRIVQLRAFPDRRAWSHLRKRGWWSTSLRCDGGHSISRGICHEAPSSWISNESSKDDTADCGSLSGMTRASSTESLSLFEDSAEGHERRTLLVWPHGVFASGASMSVEVYGSFTQPPWGVPLTLHLCPETGVSWLALEEDLPNLQPGTYEFKFLLDGETWTTNPALPICRSTPYGTEVLVENNFLRIDYRLLNCIERRMPSRACQQHGCDNTAQIVADSVDCTCDETSEALLDDSAFDESDERVDAFDRVATDFAPNRPRRDSDPLVESSSDKALEERMQGAAMAPRRNQSSADRLNTASSHKSIQLSKKAQSLPDMLERESVSNDVAKLCDLLGSSADTAGTLYDNDVTLLLELPDCKRSTGLSVTADAWYKPKRGIGDGEDSFFVSPPVMGVADGVGGLQTALGYTSKAFADELMAKCMVAAKRRLSQDEPRDEVPSEFCRKVLCEAFYDMKSYGATTGIVTYLDTRTNRLGMAILGDSGVMVVRRPTHNNFDGCKEQSVRNTRSYIVFKSPTQQHEFNYPYQLCRLPEELKKLLIKAPDMPEECVTFDVEVEEGDLILVYSDGVEDNLHDSEVLELCDHCLSPYAAHVLGLPQKAVTPASLVARAVGSAAFLRALDPNAKTPFGDEARKHGWPTAWCRGGKEDDITCIAAWVQHAAETQR